MKLWAFAQIQKNAPAGIFILEPLPRCGHELLIHFVHKYSRPRLAVAKRHAPAFESGRTPSSWRAEVANKKMPAGAFFCFGATSQIRTGDLHFTKVLLYQLS